MALTYSPASFSNSKLDKALSLIQRSELTEALQILENFPTSDPQFQIVVEEILKLSYRNQDWLRFFSYARYYRKNFEIEPKENRIYLLEPLALLRHCQNEWLENWISAFEASHNERPVELDQMKALSRTRFAGKSSSKDSHAAWKNRLKTHGWWKVKDLEKKQIHPKLMKVQVKNECDS